MTDLDLAIRMTADGRGVVSAAQQAGNALQSLGPAAQQANEKTKQAAEGATAALSRMQGAVETLKRKFAELGDQQGLGGRISGSLTQARDALAGFAGRADQASSALGALTGNQEDAARAAQRLREGVDVAGNAMTALLGLLARSPLLAIPAAIGAVVGAMRLFASSTEEVSEAQRRLQETIRRTNELLEDQETRQIRLATQPYREQLLRIDQEVRARQEQLAAIARNRELIESRLVQDPAAAAFYTEDPVARMNRANAELAEQERREREISGELEGQVGARVRITQQMERAVELLRQGLSLGAGGPGGGALTASDLQRQLSREADPLATRERALHERLRSQRDLINQAQRNEGLPVAEAMVMLGQAETIFRRDLAALNPPPAQAAGGGGGGGRADDRAARLIEELARARGLLRLDDRDRFIEQAAGRGGDSATSEQIARIRELAGALHDETEEQQLANAQRERAAELLESLKTPAQLLQDELAELEELHRTGAFSGEQFGQLVARAYEEAAESAEGLGKAFESAGRKAAKEIAQMIVGLGKAKISITEVVQTLLSDVIAKLIEQRITGPLARAAGGFFDSIFGAAFGGAAAPSLAPSSTFDPNTFYGGVFHGGGVVGSDPVNVRMMSPLLLAAAPRFHSGLQPGEFPAILERGEGVFTPAQMQALGGGVDVQIIDQRGANAPPVEVQRSRGPDGRMLIRALIRAEVSDAFDRGDLDPAFGRNYGVARQPVRRS